MQNENYETFLKESPKNLKNIALATLAKHSCVYSKITEIRNQIPNWKTALPLLLNPIKKDKPMEKVREKVQDKKQKFNKSQGNILRTNNSISKSRKGSKNKETEWLSVLSPNNTKNTEVEVLKSSLEENKCNTYEKKANNFALPAEQEKKIDDPFFIEKKVAVPKLLLYEETENKKTNTVSKFDQQQKSSKTNFNRTSFKPKEDAKHEEKEEVLHPSWAAKKIKFIKPFEGKKIKFSDD